MKAYKITGPAAAIIVATALFGTSSALAGNTVLCSVDTQPCPSTVSHVHFLDPSALLLAELFGVHLLILCHVLFLGTVLGLAAPQTIHGNFSYSSCVETLHNKECKSVIEESAGGLITVLRTGNETGEVKGSGFEVLVECAGMHCVYEAAGLVGTATGKLSAGSTEGYVSINGQSVQKVWGFLCPLDALLTTKSVSLSSNPIYLKE